jgi:nucleotide-binding universal stress UspA family protein
LSRRRDPGRTQRNESFFKERVIMNIPTATYNGHALDACASQQFLPFSDLCAKGSWRFSSVVLIDTIPSNEADARRFSTVFDAEIPATFDNAIDLAMQSRDGGRRPNKFFEADMYKRILVAIDGSETSEHAFDSALELARDNDAQLQPLYVVDNPLMAYDAYGYDPTILRDACMEEGRRLMADALTRMKHENVTGVPRIVDVAPIGEDISERIRISANEFNADLLVLGTHGRRGFKRLFLGSVAERVVRSASLPVLLVPSRQAQISIAEAAGPGHTDVAAATYELPL